MLKERWTRRLLLQTSTKFAAASVLAPLAAACAPPLPTPEAPTKSPDETTKLPPTLESTLTTRVEPRPTTKPTEVAKIEPSSSPTAKLEPASPTSGPTTRPTRVKPDIPELTPSSQEKTARPLAQPTPTKVEERTEILPEGILWTKEATFPSSPGSAFFTDKERIYIFNPKGLLEALTPSGKTLWEWQEKRAREHEFFTDEFDPRFLYTDILYSAIPFRTVFKTLDTRSGTVKWSFIPEQTKPANVSITMKTRDGVLEAALSTQGTIATAFRVIDKETGQMLWQNNGDLVYTYAQGQVAVVKLNEVISRLGSSIIRTTWYQANLSSGEARENIFPEQSEPRISQTHYEKSIMYAIRNIPKSNARLAAWDLEYKKKVWEITEDQIPDSKSLLDKPTKDSAKRLYFLLSVKKEKIDSKELIENIVAVDKQTGKVLWNTPIRYPEGLFLPESDFLAEVEDTIIFSSLVNLRSSEKPMAFGIQASTGDILWQNRSPKIGYVMGHSSGTVVGTNWYTDNFGTYGIDIKTGQVKWHIKKDGALLFGDKLVYLESETEIRIISASSGNLLKKYPFPNTRALSIGSFGKNLVLINTRAPSKVEGVVMALGV